MHYSAAEHAMAVRACSQCIDWVVMTQVGLSIAVDNPPLAGFFVSCEWQLHNGC